MFGCHVSVSAPCLSMQQEMVRPAAFGSGVRLRHGSPAVHQQGLEYLADSSLISVRSPGVRQDIIQPVKSY